MKDNNKPNEMTDKEKVVRAGWITALGIIMVCIVTTSTLIANGVTYLNVHIGIMMVLVFVYPILFFFLGVWLVMKKKFFPHKKGI